MKTKLAMITVLMLVLTMLLCACTGKPEAASETDSNQANETVAVLGELVSDPDTIKNLVIPRSITIPLTDTISIYADSIDLGTKDDPTFGLVVIVDNKTENQVVFSNSVKLTGHDGTEGSVLWQWANKKNGNSLGIVEKKSVQRRYLGLADFVKNLAEEDQGRPIQVDFDMTLMNGDKEENKFHIRMNVVPVLERSLVEDASK